jgi:hypothetical protein
MHIFCRDCARHLIITDKIKYINKGDNGYDHTFMQSFDVIYQYRDGIPAYWNNETGEYLDDPQLSLELDIDADVYDNNLDVFNQFLDNLED